MVGLNLTTALEQIKEEMNKRSSDEGETVPKQGLMGSAIGGNDKPSPFSMILDSLSRLKEKREISQKELSRYQSQRPISFAGAAVPEITDEDLRKFQSDARINPMNFSGSIIKERDILESDIMKDVRADAAEKLVEEEPTVDIAEAIEQDQIKQQDISTLKGNKVGLMSKPVSVAKDPTQQLLDRIALGEGADPKKLSRQAKHGIGITEYDMVYNYGDTLKPNKPITEMKLSELADYQRKLINATKGTLPGTKNGTSAVGKYQVVYTSLFGKNGTPQAPGKNSWADKLNLKADTIYSPAVQESIGRLALKETGYDNWMAGKKSEKAMLQRIADIWASVEGSTAKQGTHTSLKDLEPFLLQVRP